jgi:hypothetical protein
MSEVGHFRKSVVASARSVLLPATDIVSLTGHVRKVPQTEVNAALSEVVNFGILFSGADDRPSAPTA